MKVVIMETNCGEKVLDMTFEEIALEEKKEQPKYRLFWGKNISYNGKDYKSESDILILTEEIKIYSYRECILKEIVIE